MICYHFELVTLKVRSPYTYGPHYYSTFFFCCTVFSLRPVQHSSRVGYISFALIGLLSIIAVIRLQHKRVCEVGAIQDWIGDHAGFDGLECFFLKSAFSGCTRMARSGINRLYYDARYCRSSVTFPGASAALLPQPSMNPF